jgi:hypothetical protein
MRDGATVTSQPDPLIGPRDDLQPHTTVGGICVPTCGHPDHGARGVVGGMEDAVEAMSDRMQQSREDRREYARDRVGVVVGAADGAGP